jgi:hypothetical protein
MFYRYDIGTDGSNWFSPDHRSVSQPTQFLLNHLPRRHERLIN